MIAVIVVRDGVLPNGAHETVAECGGRALLVGSRAADAVEGLHGIASNVLCVEAGDFHPAAWAAALAPVLALESVVVLPASADGRDLAPRLAHLLQRPLFAGAVLVATDRIDLARAGGSELHRIVPGPTFVATLQPGARGVVVDPALPAPRVVLDTLAFSPHDGFARGHHDATVDAVLPPDPATIDLSEAERIVAGGAGLDDESRIAQLARIATAIGASTGATRVLTDRGWVPHERQIGTTGVVVDPRLYLAFGISGAVQHTSGLGAPDHVIAVNTDAHCPMMQLADLAITSDANATLDALEQLLGGRPA